MRAEIDGSMSDARSWKVARESPLRTLTFEVYDRCPLSCKHCFQGFSAENRGTGHRFEPEELKEMIRQVDDSVYDNVCFLGGEASLVPEVVAAGIEAAHERGLQATLGTAPIWSPTPERAAAFLDGLPPFEFLSLSYDEYHLEFLKPAHYENAVDAAVARGMEVILTLSCSKTGAPAELLPKLATCLPKVTSVVVQEVIPAGNATKPGGPTLEGTVIETPDDIDKLVRSCGIGGALVGLKGEVYACCQAWSTPDTELKYPFGRDRGLGAALEQMESDPTFQKIRDNGVVDGLSAAGRREVFELLRGQTVVNECQLCMTLMRRENAELWGSHVAASA